MLIAGSKALSHWLGDQHWRPINDTDYLTLSIDCNVNLKSHTFLYTDFKNKQEYLIADLCPVLQHLIKINKDDTYLDLSSCLIMKNAHKHFYLGKYKKSFKHLLDYSELIKHVTLTEEEKKLSLEFRDWLITYVYNSDKRLLKFPKLNKNKQEFFNDSIIYFVDHDHLHELLAIEAKPAYTKCLTAEVMFSNKIFENLTYLEKVNMVLEESFVLALERCLIPFLKGNINVPAISPEEAFKYSLVRVASNISSGAFRSFAADNFSEIYKIYKENHVNYYKVLNQLEL